MPERAPGDVILLDGNRTVGGWRGRLERRGIGLAYYLVEVRRMPARSLVILGRTSLMLYFLHHFIVFSFTNEWLGWKFNSWWQYGLANAVLMVILVYVGTLWLGARSTASRRFPPAWRGIAAHFGAGR